VKSALIHGHPATFAHKLPTGKKEYVSKEVTMAWVFERSGTRGTKYAGIYRDPDGHKRSAGTYSSRREALRAANREEQKVLSGTWHTGAWVRSPSGTTSKGSGFPTNPSSSRPVPHTTHT
jgi:hypothetical protein